MSALGPVPATAPGLRPACSGSPAAPVLSITNVSRTGADLSWSAAEGASGYVYDLSYLTPSGWTPWTGWTLVVSPITVRVQREGATAFRYAVAARSSCGTTYTQGSCTGLAYPSPGATCNRVELRGRPSPPSGVSAFYDGLLRVSWSAPVDDGGSPVTGYQVTASPGGAVCAPSSTSCDVAVSLPAGTVVTFTVVATNAAGSSDPSAPSNPITILGAPSPPSGVKASSTTTSTATITWDASPSGGGTTVTRYLVTARPGGRTCQSASLSCRITGLKPGAAYRFEVVADNGTLLSEPATSSSVRLPRPQAPRPAPKPTPKPSQSLS